MHNGDEHGGHAAQGHGGYGASGREPRSFNELFVIPLAIPVGAALVIAAIILSVSQILLALPAAAATTVALFIALLILLGCSYFASAPRVKRGVVLSSIALPALVLFVAGIGARIYRVNNPEENKAAAGTEAQGIPDQLMTDNKFSATAYTLAANSPITIKVQNNGRAVHNMDILNVKDASGNDIKTALLQPAESAALTFTITQPGTYDFHCDVHPTEMIGKITVKPEGEGGATSAGGQTEVTTDNKYSKPALAVAAGAKTTLTVQNKGNGVHNWHVLGGAQNPDGSEIKAPLVEAGKSASIDFQIDTPGSYPFQCDVHPEMKGTLAVK